MAACVEDGARYLRQRMLAEVGDAGHERLRAARVRLEGGSPGARAHAADYLARAGVTLVDRAAPPGSAGLDTSLLAPELRAVIAGPLAAPVALQPAADLLLGALAAVESVKLTLGVGHPATLPPDLLLLGDD